MEATAALPSHLPATEGSSECCLAPHVWCLCVCAWPREVPAAGLRQPQQKNLGPTNPGCTRLQPHPQGSLGSECGARNWSPAQPQYCHLRIRPCRSPERAAHDRRCQAGRTCANWSGEVRPTPSTGTDEQLRLWPLPHSQFSSSAAASSPLFCVLHITGMCVPLAPLLFSCSLCLAFALCSGGGPCSQFPSHHLLTLRRKVSKLQDQDGNSLLPSPTFRVGPWETDLPGPPLLLIIPPSHGTDREGV